MAEIIRMPEVLAGATEASIQTWLVEPGAPVALNQPLAEIETEKAIVELAAETAGIVGMLMVAEGATVAVGDAVLVMLAEGESADGVTESLQSAGIDGMTSRAPDAPTPVIEQAPAGAAAVTSPAGDPDTRVFGSPIVRKLANENGVRLSDLSGTGPGGRIVRRDLERHLAAAADDQPRQAAQKQANAATGVPVQATDEPLVPITTPAVAGAAPTDFAAAVVATEKTPYDDEPLSRMRRAIARRLTESKSTVPHFYLVADCRVDALLALRRSVNEAATRKISVNDFVLKAVAAALLEVPAANAIWNNDSIRRFREVDLAVAVATEAGLVTPVLRRVGSMSLGQVSAEVAELAERGRAGRLQQQELEGGSFAVSNLGMFGTTQFSAILNPPQAGILAVGAARPMPVVDSEGAIAVAHVMTVTLSADHRVLDGAIAAQWLSAFQRRIENPMTILI